MLLSSIGLPCWSSSLGNWFFLLCVCNITRQNQLKENIYFGKGHIWLENGKSSRSHSRLTGFFSTPEEFHLGKFTYSSDLLTIGKHIFWKFLILLPDCFPPWVNSSLPLLCPSERAETVIVRFNMTLQAGKEIQCSPSILSRDDNKSCFESSFHGRIRVQLY